ncbi:uncharacterized protein LOC142985063 [Anticarsia gemmatalis]|uniref:uncharacterized protein LOC142985063 n=1 Tax=Anticarsia gemmatalis TaxID=129554 RepID=UPI003F770FBF
MVEWLELLKQFGVNKTFFYVTSLQPEIKQILQHYERSSLVVSTEVSYPPHPARSVHSTTDSRRQLLPPLNDCLYRNLKQYQWIAVLDVGELIVSIRDKSWPELIENELASEGSPLDAVTIYNDESLHESSISHKYERMIGHTWRTRTYSPAGIRSLFNTSSVIVLHSRTPIKCVKECTSRLVDTEVAQLMNYKQQCIQQQYCVTMNDEALNEWRNKTMERVGFVLKELGASVI